MVVDKTLAAALAVSDQTGLDQTEGVQGVAIAAALEPPRLVRASEVTSSVEAMGPTSEAVPSEAEATLVVAWRLAAPSAEGSSVEATRAPRSDHRTSRAVGVPASRELPCWGN